VWQSEFKINLQELKIERKEEGYTCYGIGDKLELEIQITPLGDVANKSTVVDTPSERDIVDELFGKFHFYY
jgi:hypothetical protein